MKAKKKFTAWLLYDATETYTGFTLWPTKKHAQDEKDYEENTGKLPGDGVWRIRKVHVQFV